MDIADFLLARIAEDEADAEELSRQLDRWRDEQDRNGADGSQGSIVAALVDPARVLAECEAKRRIVEIHKPWYGSHQCPTCADGAGIDHGDVVVDRLRAPCPTLRLVALPYADHADYQPEWSLASV